MPRPDGSLGIVSQIYPTFQQILFSRFGIRFWNAGGSARNAAPLHHDVQVAPQMLLASVEASAKDIYYINALLDSVRSIVEKRVVSCPC